MALSTEDRLDVKRELGAKMARKVSHATRDGAAAAKGHALKKKKELMKGVGTASGIRKALSSFREKRGMMGSIGDNHHISTVGMKAKNKGDRAHKRWEKFSNH